MTTITHKLLFSAFDDKTEQNGPKGVVQFSEMTPRTGWAGSSTTSSATIAPNGDSCNMWSDTGASCLQYDLTSALGSNSFTVGFFISPTSYQAQYGNSPPQAWVIQIGPFNSQFLNYIVMSGAGTATYPKTGMVGNSFTGAYSDTASPVGTWRHVALSYDRSENSLMGFIDGRPFGSMQTASPTNMTMFIGGIGDRSTATGGMQTRYGYRGLISVVRYELVARTQAFDPLTWK